MSFVTVTNVKKTFAKAEALSGVDVNFEAAEQYVIKGASGSGKSTLLYLIGGLDRASSGEISVGGKNLFHLGDDALALYRNNFVGFIFQFHFLLPSMNCLDNILLPAKIGGKDVNAAKKLGLELAETLKVSHCLEKFPYELSGGEQQRINIIRALSLRPKLLLCDEPTGNLDSENSKIVTNLLKSLAKEFKATLIVVTHDESVAKHFEQQLVMSDGCIVSK
ncbi:hypothetical protein BIY24_02870 [Halobacteriovorax marinus]|uniref:ABC transporter ATP-binding protein n=1 Tax=Halobacteriovorax marinus (strain ATCC BAA-682 / DSM 15412 / SJ) TaxID=862908 RepID=E1X514_HALMS|nr:ABC transporter ATP-binding protein [Halobacteriovorax marinus]ATH06913.1 hypothetical protein BIY24_02870 [Halobacteriovorax marinus]CBW25485.1 ABC transporter ATP-binding protein [Halobacteriovorax marinus SJ]